MAGDVLLLLCPFLQNKVSGGYQNHSDRRWESGFERDSEGTGFYDAAESIGGNLLAGGFVFVFAFAFVFVSKSL